jgi:hypothetical protein
MIALTAAVVVVGLLCIADMLLTFGVVRRLRVHSALLSEYGGAESAVIGLSPGDVPEQFALRSDDGEQVLGPAGLRVAAFFSSTCSACPEQVPAFVEYLRSNHVERDSVLAVVVGSAGEPVPYLTQLGEVARVRAEPEAAELTTAFKVTGYPAFCLLDDDGAVVAAGYDPGRLPALVGA